MTILEQYAPENFAITEEQLYLFTFPAADSSVVEVYENVSDTERYLMPVTDYTLTFNGFFDLPLLTQGQVQFTVPHGAGVTSVTIERNTLIAQTTAFPSVEQFRENNVEFTLDKAMMICQEVFQRKCDTVVNTAMTQELTFDPYDTFMASLVNFQVDKTFTILQEIDASALDCRAFPEDT
jgi:hypothetical protein